MGVDGMNKYRVMINGQNYLMNVEGMPRRMGFYKTYFLQAETPEDAENLAVQRIIDDPKWQGNVLNETYDPPVMYLESLTELDTFDDVPQLEQGYSFYPEDAEENA